MKKLDKLIITSFIGPFILTFLVVVFILLVQHMLKYFDDIVGKDIGLEALGMLMFDFAIFMTPIAIPLAVLLSSLMTFGNLGEHFELTAVKSAGISLLRTLYPIFIFVCFLTVVAFYSNNHFVPKAALNAYSLLWDIKQTKPALDLKEGAFYNGIPDLSIKVNEKNAETGEIKDVIIYDHRNKDGNKQVVLADSGRMYTINNDSYLVLELFHGQFYIEGNANSKTVSKNRNLNKPESLSRAKFEKNKLIFDLSSFDMAVTDQSLFASNRIMRNIQQLEGDLDSLDRNRDELALNSFSNYRSFFTYLNEKELPLTQKLEKFQLLRDSIDLVEEEERLRVLREDSIKFMEESMRDSLSLTNGDSVTKNNVKKTKEVSGIVQKTTLPRTYKREELIAKRKMSSNKNPLTSGNKNKFKPTPRIIQGDEKKIDIKEVVFTDSVIVNRKNRKHKKELELQNNRLHEFVTDSVLTTKILKSAVNTVRQNRSKLHSNNMTEERNRASYREFEVQWHKIIANSFACIVMFLIGAPLGAIIKRGGLGFPVLISILFFIIFYVFTMTGEKWAKQGVIDPMLGMWSSNILLFPIGLFFLRQARNDARLFDADFYNVMILKVKDFFRNKRQ